MARASSSASKAAPVSKETTPSTRGAVIGREAAGILLLASSLFIGLSVASLQFGAGTLMGPCGAAVGLGCYALLGVGSYGLAVLLGAGAVRLLCGGAIRLRSLETAAWVSGGLFGAILLHLALGQYRLRGYSAGGLVGEYGAELMVALLGTAGTVLFGVTGLLLSAVATTALTMRSLGGGVTRLGRGGWGGLTRAALFVFPQHDDETEEGGERAGAAATPRLAAGSAAPLALAPAEVTRPYDYGKPKARRDATVPVTEDAILGEAADLRSITPAPAIITAASLVVEDKPRKKRKGADAALQQEREGELATAAGELLTPPVSPSTNAPRIVAEAPVIVAPEAVPAIVDTLEERTEVSAAPSLVESLAEATVPAIFAPPSRPTILDKKARGPLDYIRLGVGDFRLPDMSLLDYEDASRGEIDRQAMLELATRLEKTLADYGVKGRVSEIHPGPVVTMYEFVPQAGTKLSKITALSNDLAMALEALKVRIVAPIPGKAAVGIEVPNRVRETVYLKEILGSDLFDKSKSKLTMALGKDIAGQPVCVDMTRMPHLLVAGTTGSGKSVSVNAMICSMLFKASPEDVKLIMIDPKMLELSIYEGIPHLLLPVVTDPKKANLALRWAVDEMERRYELISKSGVRDIASYNKKVETRSSRAAATGEAATPVAARKRIQVVVHDESGERVIDVDPSEEAVVAAGGVVDEAMRDEISAARAANQHAAMQQLDLAAQHAVTEPEKKLPYIVIIIDEFADLMMVASKEVEQSVARIAQKARAAGIHLLLATQRPSVDVITGLIKANFPSRIAFQVASKIDARTILDQQGAESLLGMGDMLFTDRGLALKRVHGPLVTDTEIHRIVEFLKAQGKPVYDLDILKPRAEEDGGDGDEGDFADEMYDQAVEIVSEMRQASTSMLQRRLRLGYNRAARMIERMEREGIVGPADGAKPRDVLIQSHAA